MKNYEEHVGLIFVCKCALNEFEFVNIVRDGVENN